MKKFYDILAQLSPALLANKARRLLPHNNMPLVDQVLADVEKYLGELENTIPLNNILTLWGIKHHGEIAARIVCLRTFDDQAWCEPEKSLTCNSVNEYIHGSGFDTDAERWQWFLGMTVHVQRLNDFELADFAASVVLDVVVGTQALDYCDLDISSEDHGRLNRLRRAELKMLYNDFHRVLPHNAFFVPWYCEKGWSRYIELQVVDYLPCAVCGSEEDTGGIIHRVHGKRICHNCCTEITDAVSTAGANMASCNATPWNTAPKARLMENEHEETDAEDDGMLPL